MRARMRSQWRKVSITKVVVRGAGKRKKEKRETRNVVQISPKNHKTQML